jgi:dTDP-glucose pyrophosphorylase
MPEPGSRPSIQTVFVCGGKGSRLRPSQAGPKSLTEVGCASLLVRLAAGIGRLHSSPQPPLVIVDAADDATPRVASECLPGAVIVRQPRPDGVANALLLAEPLMDDLVLVALGDLFVEGAFELPDEPALMFWSGAPPGETSSNFGIQIGRDGDVSAVVEKPVDADGLCCGLGVYVLTRRLVALFHQTPIDRRTGERGITAGLQTAIEAGVRFRAIPFHGFYRNVNSSADVEEVDRYLLRCHG